MAKTILITGGAGFIGSHVAEALLARGDHVVCFDNFNDFYSPKIKRANLQQAMAHPNFSLVEADLLDREAVHQSAQGCDGIIHLAAYAGVRPSLQNPILYARVNLEGTINVLDAARALREEGTLSNLVFASSSSVYGINTKVPFDEEQYLGKAISPYAATKVAGTISPASMIEAE